MADSLSPAVDQLRRRVRAALFGRYVLRLTVAWCVVWGIVALIGRAAWGVQRSDLAWGAAGLVAALVAAWWLARRKTPEARRVRALIDRRSAGGGLIMAAEETPLGAWVDRLPGGGQVGVRLTGRSWPLATLAAGVFVAASFLMPQQLVQLNRKTPMDVSADVDQLVAQIDTMAEEQLLEPEQVDALEKELEQVERRADGSDPTRTWDALDHIAAKLSRQAEQAGQDLVAGTERLSETEALAEALKQATNLMREAELSEAMRELAQMANAAMAANANLGSMLDEKTRQQLAQAMQPNDQAGPGDDQPPLDAQALGDLAEAARAMKFDNQQQIGRLIEARLVPARLAEAGEKAGQCDVGELVRWLEENGGQCNGGELAKLAIACAGSKPGRGGISRGRGDAPMAWGDRSSREGVKFQANALPPASMQAMNDAQLIRITAGSPTLDTDAGPSASGALSGAAADGGSTHAATVLPRHRDAVSRYFQRDQPQ
jgi:hypothetical protein